MQGERILKAKAICLAMTLLWGAACGAGAQETNDVVFRAMADELDRSMNELVIEDMQPPYFLSYRIQDADVLVIEARYGALVQTERTRDRYLYVDLRVGEPTLDNSGFVATWRDIYRRRHDLPVEDDYRSLRHHLWLETDAAYKDALEDLARKKAYLQAHPVKEEIPDLLPARCVVDMAEPVRLTVDEAAWEGIVRQAALALGEYASLQDWKVSYIGVASNKRYVNSEGGRHLKGAGYQYLEAAATAQAADGQRLSHFAQLTVRSPDDPVATAELVRAVKEMAAELESMVAADPLDEYAGPVLFTDFAAAQFISQLFVSQLTPVRKPIAAEDWMAQYLPEGKLAARLNRRVFPRFISITDDPGLEWWRGQRCAGYQVVDDEGVRSEKLTLVKDGRLVGLPMGRRGAKKVRESNGHARALQNQWTFAAITNLVVEAEKPKKDLLGELRRLCREFDNEYGLLIKRLDDPTVSGHYRWTEAGDEGDDLLTPPVVAYKVYAQDGRMEPVRGLAFDEVTVRSLRDIVALGKEATLVNLRQPSGFQDLRYPAAIITPEILVEELEFEDGAVREPLPLSANPMFSR
jgi:predicted Zn-dependent protease